MRARRAALGLRGGSEATPRLMNQSILKYMVSSGLAGGLAAVRPRQQVLQLLHASGLMADP